MIDTFDDRQRTARAQEGEVPVWSFTFPSTGFPEVYASFSFEAQENADELPMKLGIGGEMYCSAVGDVVGPETMVESIAVRQQDGTYSLNSPVTGGVEGTWTLTGHFDPAGHFSGSSRVQGSITPCPGSSIDTGTVQFDITPVGGTGPNGNRPPTARCDYYYVRRGGTLKVPAPGILKNDSDPDGDPIRAVLVATSFPRKRLALDPETGTFKFKPTRKKQGVAWIRYRVSDSKGAASRPTLVHIGVGVRLPGICSIPQARTDPDYGWISHGGRCKVKTAPNGTTLIYAQIKFLMYSDLDGTVSEMRAKARLIPSKVAGHHIFNAFGKEETFETGFYTFKANFTVLTDTGSPNLDWDVQLKLTWKRSGGFAKRKTARINFDERKGDCKDLD